MRVFNKWSQFEESIFSVMSQLANSHNAVNLAQGFPDFDGPEEIITSAHDAMKSGKNQYAPSPGIIELREALAKKMRKDSGLTYDPKTEITIFSGATEAIFCSFQAFFTSQDEIITFAPYYDSYPASAFAAGAKLVAVDLTPPAWTFDIEKVRLAITKDTKAIMLNSPHNPTGHVFGPSELDAIAQLAIENDLIVITDEVYEHLVFDEHRHKTIASLPGMYERTVVISSTSKTFSFTGWKIGYTFAPPQLTEQLRKVHQYTVFSSATPLQYAMVDALHLDEPYYQDLLAGYDQRRRTLMNGLQECGFDVSPPQGSYFLLANYSKIKDVDDVSFAKWLTKNYGVACIPISPFFDNKNHASQLRYVRFGFCKSIETISIALERLKKIV